MRSWYLKTEPDSDFVCHREEVWDTYPRPLDPQYPVVCVDVHFPQAPRITGVCDNLNTHKPGVLYARYEAATARRIARRLEWVHTPKHASWLNRAAPAGPPEINVLKRQALARRIPDTDTLRSQVTAWSEQRTALGALVQWRFTTDDARVKLQSLYPPV